MIFNILLLFAIVFSYGKTFDQTFCEVSRLITNASNVHPYPEFYVTDVYDVASKFPTLYEQQKCYNGDDKMMLSGHREGKFDDIVLETWMTKFWNRHQKKEFSYCVFDTCPLVTKNIASAWKIINWNFSADALCMLGQSLNKQNMNQSNSKVKVIVLGGSMTVGHDVVGACCSSQTKSTMKCDSTYEHLQFPLHNNRWYCFWLGYLSQWFIHTFPQVDFIFHNMAIAGYGSNIMSTELEALLKFRNIKLSKADIIILDHSCNDGQQSLGLELLIREIYRLCHNFDPTIIIMEQLPSPKITYYRGYRRMARYYQLPYFSHREIILNPTPSQKNLFSAISSLPLHAPWHVHMLVADGLATWVSQLIQYKCSSNKQFNQAPSYINSSIHVFKKSPITNNSGHNTHKYGVLDIFLDENKKLEPFRCNITSRGMFIDSSPNSSYIPPHLKEFEKSIKGWTAYQDYKRKPTGWIINKFAPVAKRTLNFTIPHFNLNNDNQDEIGLRIKYLKTYINAGHVNIIVCGLKVSEIDVLTKARVSIPTLRHYVLTKNDIRRCHDLADNSRVVSLEYTGSSDTQNNQFRRDFKVKILSVKLCYLENHK